MPLAQSWGEPPPREITKSQPAALSWASPVSTLATLGLGFTPSKTTLSMSWAASRSATRRTTPAWLRPVSVTISALRKPWLRIACMASSRLPAPIMLTGGMKKVLLMAGSSSMAN